MILSLVALTVACCRALFCIWREIASNFTSNRVFVDAPVAMENNQVCVGMVTWKRDEEHCRSVWDGVAVEEAERDRERERERLSHVLWRPAVVVYAITAYPGQ